MSKNRELSIRAEDISIPPSPEGRRMKDSSFLVIHKITFVKNLNEKQKEIIEKAILKILKNIPGEKRNIIKVRDIEFSKKSVTFVCYSKWITGTLTDKFLRMCSLVHRSIIPIYSIDGGELDKYYTFL